MAAKSSYPWFVRGLDKTGYSEGCTLSTLAGIAVTFISTVNSGSFHGIMPITGAISLSQGFIFTSMILAAMSVHVIERSFWKASLWAFSAAVLLYFGIIHAYTLTTSGVTNRFGLGAAGEFAVCYAAVGVFLLMLQLRNRA
jgi:AGZA family xanthine/uracil permease-like MFS transporter